MAIKDIFTLVDLYDEAMPGPSAAIELARTLDAHVTGLSLAMEPLAPGFLASPIPADYIVGAIEEAQRQADVAARRFRDRASAADVAAEARTLTVLAGAAAPILAQAHLSDLVVIGQEDYDKPEPMRGTVIEAVLFEAGVPLLLIPKDGPRRIAFNRAVIAWDASSTAARAVHAALPLLERFATVEITIVESKRDWAGEPGADVARYLARHGLDVTINLIHREANDVAATLNRHVRSTGADLLVMGAYGHSRLREFIVGGATRGILETMVVPTLMAH
ncbi:universal stress protein [Chthonobacter rhizosphaerae]|uniref:universal stress protein n=1 Tax=Chthonobacter rhizosphaerae TaxID=2735553 RepID=UPI0015EE3B4D|nr:universal stress protein [Chthonobacter rhizosphaerae]